MDGASRMRQVFSVFLRKPGIVKPSGGGEAVHKTNKLQPQAEQTQIWRIRILFVAAHFGAILGSASVFLFPGDFIPHIAFTGFIITGIRWCRSLSRCSLVD
ncbi:MAG: hypothetical protein V3R65_07515 [Acidiferrobacterales bacterium]